ncbi:uncharacterized membrane protein YsdA (DUF1294 family) [Aequitasia blattaphilus]|uniref:DUF1294 domain-containing protein n=1 Tax=Aequitasia blattaphilus TaxID=2949332 RepID=A0ABT1E8U1_9FIRM|nr:DUF1294 domain-containing protein [Aequitasia blattaphilus]MCP1102245.1 DUF1294 domain-containing protein [Aequitasia blattaphilus]MCR8614885.1 DUF1294 domain-containing protein [Aequitasia blattaphilus]
MIIGYLLIINLITFIAFAVDKNNARKQRWRIRVTTLLGLSFIGGSLGGLLGMYLFRHKTQKKAFTIGIPFMLIMQLFISFYYLTIEF